MTVRIPAPAKINLTLRVGRARPDGLHPLQSVVAFADVGEWVEAAPGPGLSLRITGRFADALGAGDDNLVLRAARALARAAGLADPGAALCLHKEMPVASGIGGGSSDAAATLKALDRLWGLGLGLGQLSVLARELGADVPVCVGARSAFVSGAGEQFSEIALPELFGVLVNPGRPLATADVYRRFDAMGLGGDLAQEPAPSWCSAEEAYAAIGAVGNDLQAPARALVPEIAEAAAALRADARVRCVGLSGSGATLFALTEMQEDAAALAQSLGARHPQWWARCVRLAHRLDPSEPPR